MTPILGGCRPRRDIARGFLGDPSQRPFHVSRWTHYAVPTYAQTRPSCVGHATANAIEMLLRAALPGAIPPGKQIDGDAIWAHARELWHGGDLDGGLQLHEGVLAAADLGILPPTTAAGRVALDLGAVCDQLTRTPVLFGLGTHGGWRKPCITNGFIAPDVPDPFAGHAVCGVGVVDQRLEGDGADFFVMLQNSWGARWGWMGYGLLSWGHWAQSLIDNPIWIDAAPGWVDTTRWREFLIDTPAAAA